MIRVSSASCHTWLSTYKIIVHKRGFQELDIEEIMSMKRDYLETGKSNLELEARDLPATCQAVVNCAKTVGGTVGGFTLHAASYAFFETAAFIANYGPDPKPIMEFLNQPFVANAAGVAVAGVISGQINEATKKECSSTGNEIDALKAAIDAGLNQGNSGATSISVTVKGQAGSFTVDMTVRPLGESPAPKCFEA